MIAELTAPFMDNEALTAVSPRVSRWKLWCLPRSDVIAIHSSPGFVPSAIAKSEGIPTDSDQSNQTMVEIAVDPKQCAAADSTEISLRHKVVSAMSNPYNYLFALLHSCLCAPQALLGAQWLREYLVVKFQDSEMAMDGTKANLIASCTNIGAAVSSLLFGFIGKRYQRQYPSTYRVLVSTGFVLWSTSLLMIYVPKQCHYEWNLFLFAFTSGAGMGAITIIFSGVRTVNEPEKCADFASGLVSSICMGTMYASYEVTGRIFVMVRDPDSEFRTEQEYNTVFYYVMAAIIIGFASSSFVLKT